MFASVQAAMVKYCWHRHKSSSWLKTGETRAECAEASLPGGALLRDLSKMRAQMSFLWELPSRPNYPPNVIVSHTLPYNNSTLGMASAF